MERTNDDHFQVLDERKESFHVEVHSTPDTAMVQRVYEYDSGIAYTYRKVDGAELTVRFPRSAVLFLWHNQSTPDVMRIDSVITLALIQNLCQIVRVSV